MTTFTEQQKVILFWEILDLKELLHTKWAAIDNIDGDERDATVRLVNMVLEHFRPESQPSLSIVLTLLDQIDSKIPGYALEDEVGHLKALLFKYHAKHQGGADSNEVEP